MTDAEIILMREFIDDLKNLPSLTMNGTRTTILIEDFYNLIIKWEKKQQGVSAGK